MVEWIFQIHLFTTVFLTGIIWFIQICHFPSFVWIGPRRKEYLRINQRRSTWLMMPPMALEMITGFMLMAFSEFRIRQSFLVSILVLALIWGSTIFFQIPDYRDLRRKFEGSLIDHIIVTNWVRTIGWTFRSIILLRISVSL